MTNIYEQDTQPSLLHPHAISPEKSVAMKGDFAAGERTMPAAAVVGDFASGEHEMPTSTVVGDFASGEHTLPVPPAPPPDSQE